MTPPMRIQIYTGNFFPEKTGVGKYTGEMAAWLAQAGHEVEVITGFPYYPEWTLSPPYRRTRFCTESWRGVTIRRTPHYIPSGGRVSSLRRILIDITIGLGAAVHGMRTLLSRRPPDALIAICPPLFSGIWPAIIGKLRGKPWIYHIQDYQVDAAVQLGMLPGAVGSLLLRMESSLIRSASRVSSITPAMCRKAVSKGAFTERVFELPNWSDLRRIYPIECDTAFRKALGIGREEFLVMYAGAMGRKQGLEIILDAAEVLLADPRYKFVMVGSGSEAEELKGNAQSRRLANMMFLPLQPLEELNEMLGSADVHLVVQKADAADLVMPSKLTNILAAGRPAIATTVNGTALWDAVEGQSTGLAIEPENPGALVTALRRLTDEPALAAQLAGNARDYAQRFLDQDAILGRLDALLRQLTERQPV